MVPRPLRCSFGYAVTVSLMAALLAGCSPGSKGGNAAASTTLATTPRPTTTVAPTTTTTALPPNPQPSPLAAATAFIGAWKKGDRTAAATVATATAVAALFATPYTNQTVVSRGCSAEFTPRVCSYGPGAGGSGPLFEIDLTPSGSNWYVSNAVVEA
jgi:hypothetical protein